MEFRHTDSEGVAPHLTVVGLKWVMQHPFGPIENKKPDETANFTAHFRAQRPDHGLLWSYLIRTAAHHAKSLSHAVELAAVPSPAVTRFAL